MSVLIIGADNLGRIEKELQELGIHHIEHITGRNAADKKKFNIPKATRLIVVLTDYINHNTAQNVKQLAKLRGVPLVFAKRSWSSVGQKLTGAGLQIKGG